jgi:hypothetical protein
MIYVYNERQTKAEKMVKLSLFDARYCDGWWNNSF